MQAVAAVEALNFGMDHLASAARARGYQLYLLTADQSRYADALAQADPASVTVLHVRTDDTAAVIKALRNLPDLAGVIRMTDQWGEQALAAAEELGLPHENRGAIELVRDKGRLRKHLYTHQFSQLRSVVFDPSAADADTLARQLPFPCIVKDVAGVRSENVWLVRNPAELASALDAARRSGTLRDGRLTAEPYLIGPLFSAETLTWNGRTRLLGVTSRLVSPEPYFREDAASFPVDLPHPVAQQLHEFLSDILGSVGYDRGFAHTEYIVTDSGFEIVEINPRLGGALIGESIYRVLGADVYAALVDLALGRRPAMLQVPIVKRGAMAQVALYAPVPGTFAAIDGSEALARHPGEPGLFQFREAGARIMSTVDQSGLVGAVAASGETAELALYNALSAAGKLRVLMTEMTEPPTGPR
jgi:biotin carboxylase